MNTKQEYSPQQLQAYKALRIAAEHIGRNGYLAEKRRRKMTPYQAANHTEIVNHKRVRRSIYTPTQAHKDVIEAMDGVLRGTITPDEAMALLLYDHDVFNERLGTR